MLKKQCFAEIEFPSKIRAQHKIPPGRKNLLTLKQIIVIHLAK